MTVVLARALVALLVAATATFAAALLVAAPHAEWTPGYGWYEGCVTEPASGGGTTCRHHIGALTPAALGVLGAASYAGVAGVLQRSPSWLRASALGSGIVAAAVVLPLLLSLGRAPGAGATALVLLAALALASVPAGLAFAARAPGPGVSGPAAGRGPEARA